VQDDAVIKAHAANKAMIGGRWGTRFRNAFMARLPVRPERIIEVRVIDRSTKIPDAEITLRDIRVVS
jgi:hypothetical protein